MLNEFKTGKSPIMVATDVASRGIGMIADISPSPPLPISLLFFFLASWVTLLCSALMCSCATLVYTYGLHTGQILISVSSLPAASRSYLDLSVEVERHRSFSFFEVRSLSHMLYS